MVSCFLAVQNWVHLGAAGHCFYPENGQRRVHPVVVDGSSVHPEYDALIDHCEVLDLLVVLLSPSLVSFLAHLVPGSASFLLEVY